MILKVIVTTSFTQAARRLQRRYRHVRDDVRPLIDRLRDGEMPGDRIPGIPHVVYKTRLPNRDAQEGTRGGYRVIYYLQRDDVVFLLTLYAKTEQESLSAQAIIRLIRSALDEET